VSTFVHRTGIRAFNSSNQFWTTTICPPTTLTGLPALHEEPRAATGAAVIEPSGATKLAARPSRLNETIGTAKRPDLSGLPADVIGRGLTFDLTSA